MTTRTITLLAVLVGLLAVPSLANASSITLTRTPAPPSAVLADNADPVTYYFTVPFASGDVPEKIRTQILAPNGTTVPGSAQVTSIAGVSTATPLNEGPLTYTPPNGLAPGAYQIDVAYFSQGNCNAFADPNCASITNSNPGSDFEAEASATVQFDVAASVGTVVISKFEDLNGDGIREGNEPGVANWNFEVTAPTADLSGTESYPVTTLGDGTVTLSDVPAGAGASYTVSEIIPDPNPQGWAPSTAASQTFTLSQSGGTHNVTFGNARQTSLCGNIYTDSARTGKPDTSEPAFTSPVTLTLGGDSGLGAPVSATTTSNSSGRYCFENLMPGTYNVTETVPSGYYASWDSDAAANGSDYINPITVTSGQPSDGNDFGLATPAPAPARTSLCGSIYLDSARTGKPDTSDPLFTTALTLKLAGTDVNGASVSAATNSAAGRYCFTSLLPGSYSVTESVPAGYTASWDADGSANGAYFIGPIVLSSGTPSNGNNFGLLAPIPQAKLCLSKHVNHTRVDQGDIVTYTVKVRNCGTSTALAVVVTDPLIGDATLVSTGHATLVLGQLVWQVGTLDPGKSATFTYEMQFDRDAAPGWHYNNVWAQGSNTNKANARAGTKVIVKPRPPVPVHVTG